MAGAQGYRGPRRWHRDQSHLARRMGGQCRSPLHPRRYPRRLDRPRRRLGDGAKARPRRADHRYAGGLPCGRHAGRSHHQGQDRPHGRPILDRRGVDLRRAGQAAGERPRYLFHRAASAAESIIGIAMKTLGCVLAVVLWSGIAFAQDNMDWAYPVTPKPEPLDSVQLKQVPGSAKKYTQAQIDDPFNPPDWFPNEHPLMPEIVAHGGPKPAGRACAQCHLPSGDGHPESSSLAGLPANDIIRQMAAFKNGERKGVRVGVMVAMAKVLSDDDVKAAAEYFAALKPGAGFNKVLEVEKVPAS